MATAPIRKSMLGTQANSKLRTAPAFGFGTAERPKIGGGKQFVSKDMVSDKYGMASPGPVYFPKTADGKFEVPQGAPVLTFADVRAADGSEHARVTTNVFSMDLARNKISF